MGILIIFYPDIIGYHFTTDHLISIAFILTGTFGAFFHQHRFRNYWYLVGVVGILQFLWGYFLYLLVHSGMNDHLTWVLGMFTIVILLRGFWSVYLFSKFRANIGEQINDFQRTLDELRGINKLLEAKNKKIDKEIKKDE